jgi:hypothetical protein
VTDLRARIDALFSRPDQDEWTDFDAADKLAAADLPRHGQSRSGLAASEPCRWFPYIENDGTEPRSHGPAMARGVCGR